MSPKSLALHVCMLGIAALGAAAALGGSADSVAPATAAPSNGSGYGWPVAPFDRPHPVRANVGDPRTIFRGRRHTASLGGSGTFSFHDGVDIDAPTGTPVYPVVSGTASWVLDDGVLVVADDGRRFMYRHIERAVRQGARVTARQTVLGHVDIWADELHFAEYGPGNEIVNPLQPGHLTPYSDTTSPTVGRLQFRGPRGSGLASFDLHGRITVIAEAYDSPQPVERRSAHGFRLSKFARDRFPVAPALVTWSLSTLGGRVVVPTTTVVDFRRTTPADESFWNTYARGTFQNRSVINGRMHTYLPGRFLFTLTRSSLDTRRLANGVYVVTVTAIDESGNRGTLSERLEIFNARNAR